MKKKYNINFEIEIDDSKPILPIADTEEETAKNFSKFLKRIDNSIVQKDKDIRISLLDAIESKGILPEDVVWLMAAGIHELGNVLSNIRQEIQN